MKLLTHNMLTSHVKGVVNGYPLRLIARKVEVKEVQFNSNFISRMLKKIDWAVLKNAADTIGHGDSLPVELPLDYETDEGFLQLAHHALMEVEIIEGQLECPESGRMFPIQDGIPNMLLRKEEAFIYRREAVVLYRNLLTALRGLENASQRREMKKWIRQEFELHRNTTDLDKIKDLLSHGKASLRELETSLHLMK